MKRIISILMIACAMSVAASAQNQPQKPQHPQHPQKPADRAEMIQKMESAKIAFYTETIGLTPEEAKDFWPIYDSVEADQKQLQKAERDAFKALNEAIKEGKTDNEINSLLDAYINASEANVNLHFKAANSYRSVLDPVKVAKFFAAQERFRRQQFNSLRVNGPRGGSHNGPGAPMQGNQN